MQVNQQPGQVQQATRPPDIDRAFENTPAAHEARPERMGAEMSRRPSMRPPPRKPGRYGAGF